MICALNCIVVFVSQFILVAIVPVALFWSYPSRLTVHRFTALSDSYQSDERLLVHLWQASFHLSRMLFGRRRAHQKSPDILVIHGCGPRPLIPQAFTPRSRAPRALQSLLLCTFAAARIWQLFWRAIVRETNVGNLSIARDLSLHAYYS